MVRTVNRTLKALRVLRGLRQEDLALRVGRSTSWVCQVERGLVEPSDLDVALICRVLGARPEDIFPMEPDNQVNAPGEDESEALFATRAEIKKPP